MTTQAHSVLVVGDEPGMRAALVANFQRDGWQVDSAAGVNEAVHKFSRGRYPLVVSDVRMPDGDGMQVMRSVRQEAPSTAVILLTAFGSVPEAVLAVQGGASDYLVKPFSFEQLKATIVRVLAGRSPSRPPAGGAPHPTPGKAPPLLHPQ